MLWSIYGGIDMSFTKREQDDLEAALARRFVKEKLLDEMQAMRDAFNALLAKLDANAATVTNLDTDYASTLEIEAVREGGKITRL